MLQPTFKLEYNKKDITKDISDYVLNINYTDFEHGQSDEVEIIFEESSPLQECKVICLELSSYFIS